eukprot:4720326-Pleurochrysis_carterae.AAC.5
MISDGCCAGAPCTRYSTLTLPHAPGPARRTRTARLGSAPLRGLSTDRERVGTLGPSPSASQLVHATGGWERRAA